MSRGSTGSAVVPDFWKRPFREARQDSGRIVGYSYLGITSGLPVIRAESESQQFPLYRLALFHSVQHQVNLKGLLSIQAAKSASVLNITAPALACGVQLAGTLLQFLEPVQNNIQLRRRGCLLVFLYHQKPLSVRCNVIVRYIVTDVGIGGLKD